MLLKKVTSTLVRQKDLGCSVMSIHGKKLMFLRNIIDELDYDIGGQNLMSIVTRKKSEKEN